MKSSRLTFRNPRLLNYVLGAAVLTTTSAAPAQLVTVGAGPTAINYQHNWNNAVGVSTSTGFKLPSTTVNTVLNNGRIVTVDSVIDVEAGNLQVSNNREGVAESVLNIVDGSLTTGRLTLGGNGATGTLNISGGVLTTSFGVNVKVASTFNLSGGSFVNTGTGPRDVFGRTKNGVVNISGGTLTAQGAGAVDGLRLGAQAFNISGGVVALTGGQVQIQPGTTLTVSGSRADITLDSLNAGGPTVAATFHFVFDENGISVIKNKGFLLLQSATIRVDVSDFQGGDGVFNLFTAVNLAGQANLEKVTFVGLGNRTASLIQGTADAPNAVSVQLQTAP